MRLEKNMYICKKEKNMDWRLAFVVSLLFAACCTDGTPDDAHARQWDNVRFWAPDAAFPAREWTMMPVSVNRYWLRAVADGDTAMACILRSDGVLVGYAIENGLPDFRRGLSVDLHG